MSRSRRRMRPLALLVSAVALSAALVGIDSGQAVPASAATSSSSVVPSGFQDTPVLTGLTEPTAVQFAPDGRVFVAEKSGIIKVFHGLADPTPTVFADLRTQVHNFWDRGLLGLALDPKFGSGRPFVYALYTYDAAIGRTAPTWGTAGATSDGCPNPPGAMGTGCVVSGRLSKLTANGDVMAGPEQVLVSGWCQQFPSHSMGTLAFGADGQLYASAGDGASFAYQDHGQTAGGCNDPAGKGGALRAQTLRSGGAALLNGSILRLDPDTGLGSAGNPLASSGDVNARRIVAQGLRNPYRFTIRPGTNEVWAGDVGWNTWEEINRLPNPTGGAVTNFGWPCYEGVAAQDSYAVEPMCQSLPASAVTPPYFTYNHADHIVAGDGCPTGSSSITGTAFYTAGSYPASYNGALFFADYSRKCISVMLAGSNGLPDPTQVRSFISNAAGPVALATGPSGDLFYVDLIGGSLHQVTYTAGNNPPVASVESSALNGQAPLGVLLDASGSSDPDPGDTLSYSWDLNGDGTFGDATGVTVSTQFTAPGNHPVAVKVTDSHGASSVARLTIAVGPGAPVLTIAQPITSTHWAAGDPINFYGSATDPTDGVLPADKLHWSVVIEHCPSTCHQHPMQSFDGAQGMFTAPDHEYPSYLTLTMTATDSLGLTSSKTIRLDPATVDLSVASQPSGLNVAVGGRTGTTPFTQTVIVGSRNSLTALAPQVSAGRSMTFGSWSDGGAPAHDLVAGPTGQTLTATYTDAGPAGDVPHLALSPTALTVTQTIGAAPTPATVSITNTGTSDLHVASVTVDNPAFTLPPGACTVVPVGGSCPVAVSFTPTDTSSVTGQLTLASDDGGVAAGTAQSTLTLTGVGRPAPPADPITAKQQSLGGDAGLLGAAVGGQYAVPGGTAQTFVNGRIYWSPSTGAHEVHGLILAHYLQLAGPAGFLGLPTTDETATAGGAGRYNAFTGGAMYWSPSTGAREVHGVILAHYVQLGGPASLLRFPTTDETATAGAPGRYNAFAGGTMYWSPATGASEVHGAILAHYVQLGGPAGVLHFPTSDETLAPGPTGRYNTFTGATMYWSPVTGPHEVQGAILDRYRSVGATAGRLGYPTSDEYAISGGRRSDFQHGTVSYSWARATATVTYR